MTSSKVLQYEPVNVREQIRSSFINCCFHRSLFGKIR